jgi:dTDP-glucose pyrophosphorylase
MAKEEKQNQRFIKLDRTLIQALKVMDETGFRSLLVLNNDELFAGILSIGDIQRAIINNIPFETIVADVLRPNPRIANEETSLEQIKNEMLMYRMEFMPVIDKAKHIKKVYFWDELFIDKKPPPKKQFELPVVIMAGGLGTRLKPLTNVLPKPLIPFGEKTMIEEIFERFGTHGCRDFYISVNYKAELIEFYMNNQNLPYNLSFFKEEKPLGTAGSLTLLMDKIHQTFFVSNCDILIEQDYSEILDFHKDNNHDITIVAALKHYPIPYGIIQTGENGRLVELVEKPELTFKINSGMYILEPHLIGEIPRNTFYHITNLIDKVKSRSGKVGVFPVSEKSWKDIGNWVEYLSTANIN